MSEAPQHEMRVDVGGGREEIRRVDYPSNSKISRAKNKAENEKPERTAKEKIVTNPVERRERITASKIAKTFLVEDGQSIFQYIVMDVLIPAAKNTFSDVVTQAIQQAFWGGKGGSSAGRPGYTSYSRVNSAGRPETTQRAPLSRQARATHDFSDVILSTRGEAEDVLEALRTMIEQYQVTSVNDLYDLLGLTADFADAKWGWTDLRSAYVRQVRGGYLLALPSTIPLT